MSKPKLVAVRNLNKGDKLRATINKSGVVTTEDLIYNGMDGMYAKFMSGNDIVNLGGNVERDAKQGVYVLPTESDNE